MSSKGATDPGSPQSIFNSYRRLTPEQRMEFIGLVGRETNTDLFGAFWNALPLLERQPFMRQLLEYVIATVRPIFIRETIPIIRAFPELSDEELVGPISAAYERSITVLEEGLVLREQHKFKEKRDRKSSPKTIQRNAEICELRAKDPKRWTFGALQKKYHLAKSYIRNVVKNDAHWRHLASDRSGH